MVSATYELSTLFAMAQDVLCKRSRISCLPFAERSLDLRSIFLTDLISNLLLRG
eukprot:UN18208